MSHVVQFPPIHGREDVNGGQCRPRRTIRNFDTDQVSMITMLFLLMFLFVTSFFLMYFVYSFPSFFFYAIFFFFLLLLFGQNHARYTIKECFLSSLPLSTGPFHDCLWSPSLSVLKICFLFRKSFRFAKILQELLNAYVPLIFIL